MYTTCIDETIVGGRNNETNPLATAYHTNTGCQFRTSGLWENRFLGWRMDNYYRINSSRTVYSSDNNVCTVQVLIITDGISADDDEPEPLLAEVE